MTDDPFREIMARMMEENRRNPPPPTTQKNPSIYYSVEGDFLDIRWADGGAHEYARWIPVLPRGDYVHLILDESDQIVGLNIHGIHHLIQRIQERDARGSA